MKTLKTLTILSMLAFLNLCIPAQTLDAFLQRHPGNVWYDPIGSRILYTSSNITFTLLVEKGLLMTPEGVIHRLDSQKVWESLEEWMDLHSKKVGVFQIGAILLDPGHGGRDPGAVGTHNWGQGNVTLNEKDITLQLSLQLQSLLKAKFSQKLILMTRESDEYPTLEERVALANSLNLPHGQAVLFLSLHFNASLNPKAEGFEVWHLPTDYDRDVLSGRWFGDENAARPIINQILNAEYKEESKRLAQILVQTLSQGLGEGVENRGVKEKPWFVVRGANMPAVLIEGGFVTNQEEAQRLLLPEYLQKMAQSIYNGLKEFIEIYESNNP